MTTSPTGPIKVVRLVTRLNIGGPSLHVKLLSTKLDPAQFSTCLIAGASHPTEGDLSDDLESAGVRLVRLNSLRRPIHPWRDLLAWVQILRTLWTERPLILHTHMAKAGTLGRLAGLLYNAVGPGSRPGARAILIHTFHGHVLEGYFSVWLSRVFVIIERFLARRTDRLIAVSPSVRQELVKKGIGRWDQWSVIPLGVDLSALVQLPFPDGSAPVRVGFVGRLVPIKNPSLLLEALARLAPRDPGQSLRAVVVGDGPLRQGLERQALEGGLGHRIQFTGWQRDLRAVYGQLEIVCLTSWNEGTPLSIIEAMAAGRAVVATEVGGVRDLLGDAALIPAGGFQVAARGLLVRPGDVEGLTAALQALVTDAPLRRRLGEAAREHAVQTFSIPRLVRDLNTLYTQIREDNGCTH